MNDLPIAFLYKQINGDYYKFHKTLKEVLRKYDRYSEEEVKQILGVYDLSKEPPQMYAYNWFTERLRKEWDDTCRRLNPKAWSGRE